MLELKVNVHKNKVLAFEQGENRVLKYQGKLYVQKAHELQDMIMEEAQRSKYYIHLGPQRCIVSLEKSIGGVV